MASLAEEDLFTLRWCIYCASNDIESRYEYARNMVTKWGFLVCEARRILLTKKMINNKCGLLLGQRASKANYFSPETER